MASLPNNASGKTTSLKPIASFLHRRRWSIVCSIAAAIALVAVGCSGGGKGTPVEATQTGIPSGVTPTALGVTPTATPTLGAAPNDSQGDAARGASLFTANGCSACHSTGSNVVVGPGLQGVAGRAATRIAGTSADDYMHQSIREPDAFVVPGFFVEMPSFSDLSDQDVNDLVAFLKSLDGSGATPTPTPAAAPTSTPAAIDTSDLPALENVPDLRKVADWMTAYLDDKKSVLTPLEEGLWLERLTGREALLDVPDGHPVPVGYEDTSLAAKSLMLSTTTMANEYFQVRYIDSSATLDSVIPKEPWIVINHASVPMSTMRLLPSLTSVVATNGTTTIASLDTLAPIRAERTESIAPAANSAEDYVAIKTVWANALVNPTVTMSQMISLTRNTNELRIMTEVQSATPYGALSLEMIPVPGLIPTSIVISGSGADINFPDRVGVPGNIHIESTSPGVELSESSRGLLIKTSGSSLDLIVRAGIPGRPLSDLRMLVPDKLIDQHDIGAVILRASPALAARIARFAPHGFSRQFETGPYVVLVRDGALTSEPPDVGATPGGSTPNTMPQVDLSPAFPNLPAGSFGTRPTWATLVPDGSGRMVVLDQDGYIYIVQNDPAVTSVATFLDLSDVVDRGGNERGLLGLAFHPDFPTNGLFYVSYSVKSPHNSRVSEFKVAAGGGTADRASERVLIDEPHPTLLHNGGALVFGPDGYLYSSLGDGGVYENGQNLGNLHSTIFRIDVNSRTGGLPYGIPSDNPFVSVAGARPEIWAYGFRNPWRFSIDEPTGMIWVADVGERTWEEVDIVVKGGNYGWSRMEGESCFSPAENCDQSGISLPVVAYSHLNGCAVIGGYVYRGSGIVGLDGAYVYADFCSGVIRALRYDGNQVTESGEMGKFNLNISSFTVDDAGELMAVAFVPGGSGNVFKISPK